MLENKRICVIGSHPDDIELGMGGTLNQLKHLNPTIVIFSTSINVNGDAIVEEIRKALATYELQYGLFDYPTMGFINHIVDIRKNIFELKNHDVFFCPSKRSQHLDHRIIGEAVDDIMLEKTVYYYEDIRSGQNEHVNFWNPISDNDLLAKGNALRNYETKKNRPYFNNFIEMARFRGGQIGVSYAEGFEVRRKIGL